MSDYMEGSSAQYQRIKLEVSTGYVRYMEPE
jgi:hypothetical protein